MIKSADNNPPGSAHRFDELWSKLYVPDLSILPAEKFCFPTAELIECASQAGRSRTVNRLQALLLIQSELPGLEANALFTYIPNIFPLSEARRIAPYIKQVYDKVFELYQQQKPLSSYLKFIDVSREVFSCLALSSLLPPIQQLTEALEPVLSALKAVYSSAPDPRSMSFITTQFHFTNDDILQKVTPCERVLITPYLRFVEDQLCIPWQRFSAATASSTVEAISLIEQLVPEMHSIANRVFQSSVVKFTDHLSRRGSLSHAGVSASIVRDLTMFQGYLQLCVLEQSVSAIEHELLPLCLTVFATVSVRPDLVRFMLRSLELELFSRLMPAQIRLLSPYTQALQNLFANADSSRRSMIQMISNQSSPLKVLTATRQ